MRVRSNVCFKKPVTHLILYTDAPIEMNTKNVRMRIVGKNKTEKAFSLKGCTMNDTFYILASVCRLPDDCSYEQQMTV